MEESVPQQTVVGTNEAGRVTGLGDKELDTVPKPSWPVCVLGTCVYVCMYACNMCVHVCVHVCLHMCTCVCACVQVFHVCMCVCVCGCWLHT